MSLAVIASELVTCAAVWPSLNANKREVLEAYREALIGFTDEELRAGFRLVRTGHEGASFPKPAQVVRACLDARKRLGVAATPVARHVDGNGCDIKCPQCGTVTLYHETAPDGTLGRLWPWHLDGCALRRADQPREASSGRLVWPQPQNGGAFKAPERLQGLVRTVTAAVSTAASLS